MQGLAQPFSFWHEPAPRSFEFALLCTVAYADLFNCPLTLEEMHRYLVGIETDLTTVQGVLDDGGAPDQLVQQGIYFTLSGREEIVARRSERTRAAADLWPVAIGYGQVLGRLPLVRMVAVTGALAVDNAEPGDDIDYLIVTVPDRLWLCRAMVIQFVVKPAARRGVILCPNYLLSERALTRFEHNLFTAHEIVQMVPVAGHDTYQRLCDLNRWAERFLPNAYGRPRSISTTARPASSPFLAVEPTLRSRAAGRIERWERERKIARFHRESTEETEASFSKDWCKGHFESHGRLVREALYHRLERLDWAAE